MEPVQDPGEAPAPLIAGHGLSKSFPGVRALHDVNFSIRRGVVHVLVGENGAGKSTLVKIFSGVHAPDRGALLLDGRRVSAWDARSALDGGIATIYQEFNLVAHLSVAENIFLGREPTLPGGVLRDRKALHRGAQALLGQFEVDIDPDERVRNLGVAQRQTVEILKALSVGTTRVLMLDEPTAALSARETDYLFATIRRLTDSGVGILYISHRLDEVKEIGDEITVMRDGRIVSQLPAAQMRRDEIVALMVGRELQDLYPPRRPVAPTAGHPALRVQHVAVGKRVLDASFDVRRGEVVGLFGLIGAGRTELVRAIVGADRLRGGRVEVAGRLVHLRSPHGALRVGVGIAPEDRKRSGIVPNRSVRDNISLAALAQGRWGRLVLHRRVVQAACEGYIRQLRIKAANLNAKIGTLSGGNQQKVVLARLLAADADVLILDEPTRGIDVGAKGEVYNLIARLAQEGRAILVVTSDLEEALGISDRLLVMRTGLIVGELNGATTTREQALHLALPASASVDPTAA